MGNKIILGIFISMAIIVLSIYIVKSYDSKEIAVIDPIKAEKNKIAACPTCFEKAQKLDSEKYRVIPTASTAESVALLAKGSADMILAGRTLKPGEAAADFLVLADGYSFLSDKPLTASVDQIKESVIYSDLDIDELKQKLPDFSFQQVDDVYEHLEKGIVLTTWENTDYFRAQIAHIIEKDGRRLALSRQPTLYCPTDSEEDIAAEIKSAFD